jgi:Lar family restriction alleviation protein
MKTETTLTRKSNPPRDPLMPINLVRDPEDKLMPCPFCGNNQVTIENTHSPCYWVECECGAEMHSGGVKWKTEAGKNNMSNHRKAKQMAIDAWNQRAAVGRPRPRFLYGSSAPR